jgi:hypothetical protein
MKNTLYFTFLVALLILAAFLYDRSLQTKEPVTEAITESPFVVVPVPDNDWLETVIEEDSTTSPTLKFATLNIPYEISDLTIILSQIIEDSRCPSDVTCIQAGTVRVRGLVTKAGESIERTFVQSEPQGVFGTTLTLVDVMPRSLSTVTVPKGSYEFYFTVGE